ncbi:MAG: radical SAM protein [Gammaproteobacteria bacterium]|nr:MAG: radical SAM protein [Gammaproteobacteria bacterium]
MSDKDVIIHARHEQMTERIFNSAELMLPARYVYILTNLCNLRCPFCFQYKHKSHAPMLKDDWLRLTGQLPDYARVTLTGGEPLVYKGFLEILDAITVKHDCNLITNGILLDEEWINQLLARPRLKVISISVDDVGNHNRLLKSEQWQHLTIMARILVEKRDALHSETLFDIKTVVLDENAGDLFDIYRFCVEELHCDSHAFQFLKGSTLQHADTMFDPDDIFLAPEPHIYERMDLILEQLEKVRRYAVVNGKRSYLHPPIGDLQSAEHLPDIRYINTRAFRPQDYLACRFPWSSVHINADGHLFPCLAVSMGNVRERSLADIIGGEAFVRFRKTISENGTVPACHRCGWLRPKPALSASAQGQSQAVAAGG